MSIFDLDQPLEVSTSSGFLCALYDQGQGDEMGYREELDTPSHVILEEVLQRNLKTMADYAKQRRLALRPHFKTHKTAAIARRQLELGAVGMTCAKLGEAEALVGANVCDDFFIANQIVGPIKYVRLVALMKRAKVRVAVDTVEVAAGLNAAIRGASQQLNIIIELNTGQNRAGVEPGEAACQLAKRIRDEMSNLTIIGVMTHEGHAGLTHENATLREKAIAAGTDVVATAELLRRNGFDITVVSVGSTPAAFATTTVEGITEMRPGTYVFNDAASFRLGLTADDCALRILATVTSRPAPDRAILDTGSKALTSDSAVGRKGFGYIVEYPDAVIERLSEEHGVVSLPEPARRMKVGDKVQVIPNHVCPTVNLQDELNLIRDGNVVETWPVIARGKSR